MKNLSGFILLANLWIQIWHYGEYNFWGKNFIFVEPETSFTKTRQQKQIGSLIEIRLTEGVKQRRYNFLFSHDHLFFFYLALHTKLVKSRFSDNKDVYEA